MMKPITLCLLVAFQTGLFAHLTSAAEGESIVPRPLILDMVSHNPDCPPYISAYNYPSVIKQMGFNGKVYSLFESPTLAINWESVDPDILPRGSEARAWADAKAAEIRTLIQANQAAGLNLFFMSDLVLFPKRLIEHFGIQNTFGDPRHPMTEQLIRAQINEIFDQFPETDGLVVRIGETYLHGAPYHLGSIRQGRNIDETIIPLLQILREEICVKRNKTLIFRTWMSFDSTPDGYQKVSDTIEPHPNLVIGIKHVEGDFHRTTLFSRSIGQGRHPQIVEVQCAREYEGKAAYPNYIAHGVIEGFEEHANMPEDSIRSLRDFVERKPELYAGMWTWTRGGGWEGPFVQNERWADINAWVIAQWAQDTTQSEEAIFRRYASERLGLKGGNIDLFRHLCLLSADAVLRGRNSTHRDMNEWWTRDQGFAWPMIHNRGSAGRQRNLAQKDESIALWREIVELAKAIEWPNEREREHAIGSSYYGLRLYEIKRNLIYLEDAVHRNDRDAMQKWLQAYDASWQTYDKLPTEFSQLASLYTRDFSRHIHKPTAEEKIREVRAALAAE